jgi:hypothetical protein
MNNFAPAWLSRTGASAEVLHQLQAEVGPLPGAYLELLRIGNGGEVGLSVDPLVLCLDSAEDALAFWRSGTYTANNVFVFGGNGGGELLAFDLRSPGEWPVVSYDPIDPEGSMQKVAADFERLLDLVEDDDA